MATGHRPFSTLAGLLLAMGCGPSVLPDLGAQSSTDAGDAGSETGDDAPGDGAEEPSDDNDPVEPDPSSDGPNPDPGGDGSSDGGTFGGSNDDNDDDNDDNDDFECGCEENVPVALDEVVAEDFSAETALELFGTVETPFRWMGLKSAPPDTVLHASIAYDGGEIAQGPGGEDGCAFLSGPCPNGLIIPVTATITTDDGIVAAVLSGTLEVDFDRYEMGAILQASGPVEAVGGTLLDEPIVGSLDPLTDVYVRLGWALDGTWDDAWLGGDTETGLHLLGSRING